MSRIMKSILYLFSLNRRKHLTTVLYLRMTYPCVSRTDRVSRLAQIILRDEHGLAPVVIYTFTKADHATVPH